MLLSLSSSYCCCCLAFFAPHHHHPPQSSSSTTKAAATAISSSSSLLPKPWITSTTTNRSRWNQQYRSTTTTTSLLAVINNNQQGTSSSSDEISSSSSTLNLPPAISIENLSCTHNGGETYQLYDVKYVLQRGSKVALIGRNGTGKSTLLKILAESCRQGSNSGASTTTGDNNNYKYTGQINCPKTIKVAIVEQEPPMPSDITVGDAILGITTTQSSSSSSSSSSAGGGAGGSSTTNTKPTIITSKTSVYEIVRLYKIASTMAEIDPEFFTQMSAVMDERDGSWDVFTKAEEIATKLRVQHLQNSQLSKLSGGERKRVALCSALVEEPDVLLLDEPTNFLSLAGVQWLAELLTADPKLTVLMVTHDRAFLEDVSDRILELDRGKLYEHNGKYSTFLQAKQERLANEDAAIQSSKAKYRIELDWMRRQPQARASKAKARIDAFYKLEKSTKPRPLDPNLNLGGGASGGGEQSRLGTKIISMRNVSLKFGDRVMLDDFSYDFCSGDRICLAGANGVGKTTFTKLITGEIQPSNTDNDGAEIEIGDTVVLGVYDQLGLNFDDSISESDTVLDFVLEAVQARTAASSNVDNNSKTSDGQVEVRRLLGQFEFPRNRWNERVSMLSGGERRRLQLLSVLTMKPNFLILDEPSVDCDMDTLSALETFLQDFKGVLLIVSHDRSFADKVTDHLFIFEGDGVVKDFQGSLSEYASCLVELENDKIQNSASSNDDNTNNKRMMSQEDQKAERQKRNEVRNFVRKAKKEMNNIENAVEKLKSKAVDLQTEIDNSSDEGWTVLADLTDQLNKINDEIDTKEMRWLELGEELEGVEIDL